MTNSTQQETSPMTLSKRMLAYAHAHGRQFTSHHRQSTFAKATADKSHREINSAYP